MKKTNKVIISTSSFGTQDTAPLQLLAGQGFDAVLNPFSRKLTEGELGTLLQEHRPVGLIAGVEPITADILTNAKDYLKVVSRVGVGWDNVDHDSAAELGIKVYRTEGVLDQAVAELTIGYIINALRNLSLHDRQIRQGTWDKKMGSLLHGKNLGIIGFGAIGQKVGEIATVFGAEVSFSDICDKDSECAVCVTLEKLLENSDIVTIHASGCDKILGDAELARCKKGVILINTARGGLIDEEALYNGLQEGRIGYACLDVFENEPYSGPLTEIDNIVMTPHIGSYARESRISMELMSVDNLLKGLTELGEK